MKVQGTVRPVSDKILVSDMDFGEQKTSGGIVVASSNGKANGIVPRWGRVWAVGPEQRDVSVGEWILIEHGRWTRTIEVETANGDCVEIRLVDNNAVMASADAPPEMLYHT
jgi:co-chaperonin GroES (HSP10)